MTYPSLRPPRLTEMYVPRVFGFKLHPTAMGRDPPVVAAPRACVAGPSVAVSGMDVTPQFDRPEEILGGAEIVTEKAAAETALKERRGKRREDDRDQI